VEIESHNITIEINREARFVQFSDEGSMRINRGWNIFTISEKVEVHSVLVDNSSIKYQTWIYPDDDNIPDHFRNVMDAMNPSGAFQIVAFRSENTGSKPFYVSYSGEFYKNIDDVRFSKENAGGEIKATVTSQGAYFNTSAYYYPTGRKSLSNYSITANIPAAWESISDGNRISNEIKEKRKIQTWSNPYKSDGIMFMAAPFVTKSTWVDDIEVACYFFEADTNLFDQYLQATAGYIRQYSELIGPYPYQRFTVVENYFPTGYGMPAWTLLGQQIIRLPFIVYTSLGHEVLHNWWGNSVYVDFDRGNWCESATVYGADYRFKLKESSNAAKDIQGKESSKTVY